MWQKGRAIFDLRPLKCKYNITFLCAVFVAEIRHVELRHGAESIRQLPLQVGGDCVGGLPVFPFLLLCGDVDALWGSNSLNVAVFLEFPPESQSDDFSQLVRSVFVFKILTSSICV